MKKILIALCSILLLLQSCNRKKNEALSDVQRIDVDVEKARSVKFSEVFSSIKLIPLSNDSLMGGVRKTIFSDKNIYFLCGNGIFIFDRQGEFKNKINRRGDAPQEYKISDDIGIDGDTIEVLDWRTKRILSYALDGTYLKEWKIGFRADKFSKLDNDRYAFYKGNDKQKEKDFKFALLSKSKNEIMDEALEIDVAQAKYLQFMDVTNFSTFKTETTFSYATDYIVYHIVDNKLAPRFRIDFGKHNVSDEFLNHNYQDVSYFVGALEKSDYAFLIDAFSESDNTIFFGFGPAKEKRHVFWSKATHESIVSHKMIDDIDNLFTSETDYAHMPKTITDNQLCYLLDPMEMEEKLTAFKEKNTSEQWQALLKKYPVFEALLTKTKPINNPIILLATLK